MRMGSGEGSTMKNFVVFTVHLIGVIRAFRTRRLRCAGHVVRMEEVRSPFKILTDIPTFRKA